VGTQVSTSLAVAPARAVTMNDVATLAGVSLKTVSNVINDYPHVREETRRRVTEAIAALGYRVNTTARNLRRGRTGMIGLAVPELQESYFGELADAVVQVADSRGLSVLIEATRADAAAELAMLANERRSMTDGLLFSPLLIDAEQLRAAVPANPVVLLGERVFGVGLDHASLANIDGTRAATAHLISRGARRVAAVGSPAADDVDHRFRDLAEGDLDRRPITTTSEQLRIEGYRRALAEAGLPYDPDLLLPTGPWRRASGAAAVTDAIDRGLDFDGVVGLNDAVALGAPHALAVRGVDVPGSVQVIGFDDLDESAYATPALTTVHQSRLEVAQVAFELLLDRFAVPTREPRLVVLPFTLVERDSTR